MEDNENRVHRNSGYTNDGNELSSTLFHANESASVGVTMTWFKSESEPISTLASSTPLTGPFNIAAVKRDRHSCLLITVTTVVFLFAFAIVAGVFFLKSAHQVKQVQNNIVVDQASGVKPTGLANASIGIVHEVLMPARVETGPSSKNLTRASVLRARSWFTSSNSMSADYVTATTGMCVEIPDDECQSILPYIHTYFPNGNDLSTIPSDLDDIFACHKDAHYLFCSKVFPQCFTDPDPLMPCRQTCEAAKASCVHFNTTYEWPFNCDSYPENTTVESSCRTNDRVCYETLLLDIGEVYDLTSPNYPDDYPENSDCLWRFTSPPSTRIRIDFINVVIEDFIDELVIGFGDNPYVVESTMLQIIESGVKESIASPWNKAWIQFVTDSSVEYSGFKVQIEVVEDVITCLQTFKLLNDDDLCDGIYDCPDESDERRCLPDCLLDMYTTIDQNGTLTSLNCSYNHPECLYLFTTPIHTRARLEFQHFRDTYNSSEGFKFGVGHNPFALESEIPSIPTTSAIFELDSNEGWIWFTADNSDSSGSFSVHISQITEAVSVQVDENQTYHLDSREEEFLNNTYSPFTNAVFTWKFVTSARMQFDIQFPDGLETLIYNTIEIGIGSEPSRESTKLYCYGGGVQVTEHTEIVTVADNFMWMKYKGAIFHDYMHIHAMISAVPKHDAIPDVTNLAGPNVTHYVSLSDLPTKSNTNLIWIIGSEDLDGSTMMSVECISLDETMLNRSYILIGRGQDPSDSSTIETVLHASYPTDKCPNDFTVSHSHVWVKFVGTSEVDDTGFTLAVTSISYEDALDQICSTKKSVSPEDVCNNRFDCPDLTDELGCLDETEISICGTRPLLRPAARIVGGSYSQPGSWPWMGSLQLTTGEHMCGCTLIDENWAVTAAHCTIKHEDNELQILFGSNSLESLSQYHLIVKVTMVYPHPDYKEVTGGYDITLLRLAKPVPFTDYIRPACLSFDQTQFQSGRRCFVSGWGFDGTESSVRLQDAAVPVMTNAECNDLQGSIFNITNTMICAGYPEGGIDACQGDSGGPLVCPNDDGKWHLAGITSFGLGCGLESRPGVYTRVSQFKDYIDTITGIITRKMYFQCSSGFCLLSEYVCDGEHDCYSGEDEGQCSGVSGVTELPVAYAGSNLIMQACTSNQFDCGGKCIHINYQCDGIDDCETGVDELTCSCKNWETMCSDGTCIGYWQECDGISDCNDGADEHNCTDDCTLNSGELHRCPNGKCISQFRVCNRRDDCGDNSDELDCPMFYDLSTLRFVDSNTSHSVVEVYELGLWQHLHINNFKIANVVCRQMGFSGAASYLEDFSQHNYNAQCLCSWLNFDCQGDEESINDCQPYSSYSCDSMTSLLCSNECSEEQTLCPGGKASPYQCIPKTAMCDGLTDCYGVNDVPRGTDESQCFRMRDDNDGIVAVFKNERWSKICVQPDLWKSVYEEDICYQLHKGSPLISEFVHDNDTTGSYAALQTDSVEGYPYGEDYRNMAVQGLLRQSTTCESGLVLRLVCAEQEFENEIEDCGVGLSIEPVARIVGGDEASLGRWPWQVSFQFKGQHWCGGSLINHQWVVTASHCVIGWKNGNVEAWLGSINAISANSQTLVRRNISKIIPHPTFDYLEDDYALIMLSEPVAFSDVIKPVCLPTSSMTFEPGSYGYTTGWGSVKMYGLVSAVLQEVRVPIISIEYCRRHVHFIDITEDMICLKDRHVGQGACHGDSGGPFVVDRDGRWYLVGVVNGGRSCGGLDDPTIYARVSSFLDFTYYTMWEHGLTDNLTES